MYEGIFYIVIFIILKIWGCKFLELEVKTYDYSIFYFDNGLIYKKK